MIDPENQIENYLQWIEGHIQEEIPLLVKMLRRAIEGLQMNSPDNRASIMMDLQQMATERKDD